MAWEGSDRRSRLPSDWPKVRKRILRRDRHRCVAIEQDGQPCGELATDVDHVRPGDDHSDENLQSLCSWHHKQKSASEGQRASAARRAEIDSRFRWSGEEHPGLLA